MEAVKISIIKSETQYNGYCRRVEELLDSGSKSKTVSDEIDLLSLLIEKYDDEHNTLDDAAIAPVLLLKSFMADAKLKAVDMAALLGVSKGLVSDILNYKKGMSKEIIRKLAERFKVRQDAFNRPYKLKSATRKPGIRRNRAGHKAYTTRGRKVGSLVAKEPTVKYAGVAAKRKKK